jgi:DNA (cytosine-5)-methyltransferase 1
MKQQTFIADCLTPWDTQQKRIFTPESTAPTLAGVDGGGRNPGGLVFVAGVVSKDGGDGSLSPPLPDPTPAVLCLNDQGGQRMDVSENKSGTLRAGMDGHPPLVMENRQDGGQQSLLFENHGIDSRYTGPHAVAPALSARCGTGGNNMPLVGHEPDSYCIAGNAIDRQARHGGHGLGCQPGLSYTLTGADRLT